MPIARRRIIFLYSYYFWSANLRRCWPYRPVRKQELGLCLSASLPEMQFTSAASDRWIGNRSQLHTRKQ